jgi:hypothetical protein
VDDPTLDGRHVFQLALPDGEHFPTAAAKLPERPPVARRVPQALLPHLRDGGFGHNIDSDCAITYYLP